MEREILPVYVQIAAQLREHINQGIYGVGEKLPTEAELAHQFEVNRHTLRQAIALLKTEGLLRVDRGRGMFVVGQAIRYPIGKRVRYNQMLKQQGKLASYKLLRMIEVVADSVVSRKLEINQGESVGLIERLGFADDEPILVTTGYFPLKHFPGLIEPEKIEFLHEHQSISKLLRQVYECDHIRRSTTVSARLVQPQDARLLGLPLNQPILLAESLNENQAGNLVEYGVTRLRGDRVELVFENDPSI